EVEEALVRLDSAGRTLPQARRAVDGYRTNFLAVQQLYQVGLGSLIDVETARRNVLSAEMAVKEIEQERVSAWIALYRAAGGSWKEHGGNSLMGSAISSVQDNNKPETSAQLLTTQADFTGGKQWQKEK
ncbi:MAG: TolC family protein, partial [Methylosarcina sp.]